ncbi:hypothetical protein JHJ32_01810 [Parapedobacter sp. ISTM3]|uniref:hypothetical protein n=1 Tax=Parapedobacter sp. ISTM3 TaxID=2800130 RepID=UPI001907C05C|nr:hypothetical protein [Parapedobacter sp. ISTM3]MBK1438713.1 hypothetical protein [Parapedobacter sp. ISTM3]
MRADTSPHFFEWLESTPLASGIRQSLWAYPVLEITHIVGIIMLVGGAFLIDLHLLGFSRNLPFPALSRYLLAWSAKGLLLIIPSGILLFMTNAASLASDPTFRLKLALLGIAGLNAWVFHKLISRRIESTIQPNLPSAAKISAFFSVIVWLAIIACGRLLAY